MDKLPANTVDLIVIAVMSISALLAFSRGFTREILSITGWIAAIFATLYGIGPAKLYVRQVIAIELLADIVTGVVIFVATLAVVSLLSHLIARRLHDSAFGALDRSLGVLFGLLRGAVFLCLGYLLTVWLYEGEKPPDWLLEARSAPALEKGADLLAVLAPGYSSSTKDRLNALSGAADSAIDGLETIQRLESIQNEVERLSNPQPLPGKTAEQTGYSRRERQEMDRLHQSLGNN